MKYMKKGYLTLFVINALVIVASIVFLVTTLLGLTPTGIWFPIALGSVAFVDILAAAFALGIYRLKREF